MPNLLQVPAYQPHGNIHRTDDYESRYEADEPGKAGDPGARIWKIYLDEADSFDHDMLQGFRDNIDSLLIFAALFSAVVTAFTVETKDFLEPNYAQITALLLVEQLQLLRTGGNVTAMNNIPSSTIVADTETPSALSIWMAGLFITSLSLSLATALLSILVKQWLTSYSSLTSGDTQLRCLIRQFRFSGLEKWKLPQIITFLPLLLHFSLAIFLAGFSLFVYSLYPPLSAIIITISATTFVLYISSAVLPVVYRDCPFRIPILQVLLVFFIWLWNHARMSCFCARLMSYGRRWTPPLSEPQIVQEQECRQTVVIACLTWLFHQTSSRPLQKLTTFAAADLAHTEELTEIPWSWWEMIPFACNELFTPNPPPNHELVTKFLSAIGGDLSGSSANMVRYPPDILDLAVQFNTDFIFQLLDRGLSPDYLRYGFNDNILELATRHRNISLVQALLERGARCDRAAAWTPPLSMAAANGDAAIASLLLKKGAKVNRAKHSDGRTPLHISSALPEDIPSLPLVELLFDHQADPKIRDRKGRIPLHHACISCNVEVCEILISHHNAIEVDAKDRTGRSPLRSLLESPNFDKENIPIITFLLEGGANPNTPDDFGVTPLSFAEKMNSDSKDEVIELLRSYNSKESLPPISSSPTQTDS